MGTETVAAPGLNSRSSDDEILGLTTHVPRKNAHRGVDAASRDLAAGREEQLDLELGGSDGVRDDGGTRGEAREESRNVIDAARRAAENLTPEDVPPNLREVFEANPELRDAWRDVNEYRETFATPEEARSATALLGDLNRMDSLFYSRRPEDHAELARAVAKLDPTAFASLAREMANLATSATQRSGEGTRQVRRIAEGEEGATSRNPLGGIRTARGATGCDVKSRWPAGCAARDPARGCRAGRINTGADGVLSRDECRGRAERFERDRNASGAIAARGNRQIGAQPGGGRNIPRD